MHMIRKYHTNWHFVISNAFEPLVLNISTQYGVFRIKVSSGKKS